MENYLKTTHDLSTNTMNQSVKRKRGASSQESSRRRTKNSSIPAPDSQIGHKYTMGIRSLPNELLGQIVEEVIKDDMIDTRARNRTRNLPAFISSLRCAANHPRRTQYLFALDTCNKTFIHSLHFGNGWSPVDMDHDELNLIRNIVVKFVPTLQYEKDVDIIQMRDQIEYVMCAAKDHDLANRMREEVTNSEIGRSNLPSPSMLKSSLEGLPNVCSVQLEFKGSRTSYSLKTFLGMFRRVKNLLNDKKDYKLKTVTIESENHRGFREDGYGPGWAIEGKHIKQILIADVTVMAGREVGLVITSDNIWNENILELRDVATQEFEVESTINSTVDGLVTDSNYRKFSKILLESKWTWVLERKIFSGQEAKKLRRFHFVLFLGGVRGRMVIF